AWTLCMLFLPRILGIVAILLNRQQQSYGGTFSLLRSAMLETLIAMLQAPVRMLAHSLFVVVALTGLKLEWKSPPREAAAVPWRHALAQLAPISGLIIVLAIGIFFIDARALVWLLPVGLPLLLAIPMTVITSKVGVGTLMRAQNFLLIPEETRSPAVLRRAWLHASKRAKPLLAAA
ncbi:MAG: glucans biosynthesis glucosyltransferase MdoH, partial [Pseudomonadota bacterium]